MINTRQIAGAGKSMKVYSSMDVESSRTYDMIASVFGGCI